jgi:hypothetical protein
VHWRAACGALLLASCAFHLDPPSIGPDATGDLANLDPPWWDDAWGHRRRLVVTTGVLRPDKGYAGYTVRIVVEPALLAGAACEGVRVVVWDGTGWTELARHLIGCGTAALDLRFALPVDLGDSATWRDAFLYYDQLPVTKPEAADGSAVYLWWDPATTDRSADYQRGRMDPWLSTGHDDSLRWDGIGAYAYNTGDDSQSSYRRAVDERDVLVEASWFHTGCYSFNMQSGVCARGVIASGAGASEAATHYYCTSRAQNPACANNDQGLYDGDIVAGDNETIALQGLSDPPPIVPGQWRTQALAVFGTAPTLLRFWDADAAWPGRATPEHMGRGFAGLMTAQDIGQIRDVVIRRYTEPEPIVEIEDAVARPRPAARRRLPAVDVVFPAVGSISTPSTRAPPSHRVD